MALTNAQAVDTAIASRLTTIQTLSTSIIAAATSYLNGFHVSAFEATPIAPDYIKYAPGDIAIDAKKPADPRIDVPSPQTVPTARDLIELTKLADFLGTFSLDGRIDKLGKFDKVPDRITELSDFIGKEDLDNITPVNDFQYTETAYQSTLWDATKAKLLAAIQAGGSTLPTSVQTGAWNASEARNLIALQDAKERLIDNWSGRGWSMPDGYIADELAAADIKFAADQLAQSLQIAYEQAKLAVANDQFTVTSSLAFETMAVTHAENVANRALEAAKASVEFGIAISRYIVDRYIARLNAYRTALAAEVEWDRLKIEGNKLEIERYVADVNAATTEYTARLSGYKSTIDGETAYNHDLIEKHRDELAVYTTDLNSKIEVMKAKIEKYTSDLRAYGVEIQKAEVKGNIQLKQQEMTLKEMEHNSNLALDAAAKNMSSFIEASRAAMTHDATMGGVYSNFLTGVLNAISLVMNMGSNAAYTESKTV